MSVVLVLQNLRATSALGGMCSLRLTVEQLGKKTHLIYMIKALCTRQQSFGIAHHLGLRTQTLPLAFPIDFSNKTSQNFWEQKDCSKHVP